MQKQRTDEVMTLGQYNFIEEEHGVAQDCRNAEELVPEEGLLEKREQE